MASLNGQTIAASYEQLLHVDADGGGNGTTHVSVKDGDNGTTFGFTIATDALMMTSTNRLEFGDNASYIHQSADGVLDLVSDTEIELNATTIDINGAVDMSSTLTVQPASGDANAFIKAPGSVTLTLNTTGTSDHVKINFGDSGDDNAGIIQYNNTGDNMVVTAGNDIQLSPGGTGSVYSLGAGGTTNTAFGKDAGDALESGANHNALYGLDAGGAITTADGNTLVGYQTGDAITSGGDNNTGIRYQALSALTSGDRNIAIGYEAGLNMTAGSECVFIGAGAGKGSNHTDGDGTVCVGYQAGIDLVEARRSTAIGYQTLHDAVNNDNNTAVGYTALASADTGLNNTAMGVTSLLSLRSGNSNVAIGYNAMSGAISATNNVAIGAEAMQSLGGSHANNGEDNNVAIGQLAMGSVDGGSNESALVRGNIAIGKESLTGGDFGDSDINLDYNIAIGQEALNSTGANQQTGTICIGKSAGTAINSNDASGTVIVGHQAGMVITEGQRNTAIGHEALKSVTNTDNNTAVGFNAGTTCNSGFNVFVGRSAGGNFSNPSGGGDGNNTFVGAESGETCAQGINNTLIGKGADVDASSRDGCVIIGSGLSLNTGSDNFVEIGNDTNSLQYDLDGGDVVVTSDVRTKKDIEDSKIGLDFINKLRTVTYKTKASANFPEEFGVKNPTDKTTDKLWDGMIAQEVKSVMDEMGVDFSGWTEGLNTKQGLQYAKFIMPLVKAVQELSAKVTELENK